MIASHYAEPLARQVVHSAALLAVADDESPLVAALAAGETVRVLDIAAGWAWGYAPSGEVGYVRAAALGA